MNYFIRSKNLIIVLAIFAAALIAPTKSYAQTCVDMLDYFNPSGQGSANLISSGERFYNVQSTVMGMPGFYIVKNATGEVYEEFAYDANYIYHLRDTSWATENGNVQCEGFDAGFTMVAGNVDPNTVDLASYAPAKWIKRNMCEGDVMTSDHTIVGFKKDGLNCSRCNAPFTGYTGFAMKFNRHYDTYNVGGSLGTISDVVEVQILEGNGKGETFLYAKDYGWIGFGRGSSITNKVTATAPKVNNVKVCALLTSAGGTGESQCVGPIKTDQTLYRGQVIGHQDPSPDGKGPWQIYASATDEKENEGDIVSAVVTERIVIAPTKYWSTDFSTMTQKYIGSLAATNDDFINNKAIAQYKPSTITPRSLPLYITSHIPGFIYQGGLEIQAQPEKQGTTETYAAFQARVYPSQDGIKPGRKSTIDNLAFNQAFIGCLQSSVCDPSTGEECLKNDKSGEKCGPGDPPEACIGMGHLIKFSMNEADKIKLLEPADRQAMDKVLWDFSAAVVKKPGDTVPIGRSTILATSLEDYYAQEQQLLAKQNADQNKNTQSYIADVVLKTPTDSDEEIGTSYSLDNINPVNPKQAQAQAAPPYEEAQPYCQGAHILIENKTAENQFSVKVWNGQPECPQPVDWGYYIEYWVTDKTTGQSTQISTCGNPNGGNLHKSAGLPIYNPNGNDGEKYGVPIETLPGCSIPVTPRELAENKMELKVHFQITNSSAPYSDNPNCTQRPVCTCPNEGACGIVDDRPPPPIDCTKCETWAPGGECATMDAEDLLEVTDDPNCEKGFCQTGNQTFRLAKDIEDKEDISISVGNIFSDFIKSLYAAGAKLFNYHCEKDEEEGYTDINGVYHEGDEKWSCTFGERQYLLYGYVPSRFMGKLNQNRSNYDFQVFQGLYKVPGVSDSYFDPKPSKHELELKLSLGGISGSNASGNNTTPNCGSNPLSNALARFGLGGPQDCLDLSISGSDTRSMYIEYTDHFSQAAQYCLSEAAGSLPSDFPTRAIGLCEPFLSSLRGGGNFFSSAPGSNNISGDTLKQIENVGLDSGVPARLIAVILDIEGGGSLNSCSRNSVTATGPFQITDDTVFDITDPTEQKNWNIQRWAAGTPQSEYRKDGRCNPQVAPTLAARVLKQKAGVDYRNGTISESNFDAVKRALRGYYGSCRPDEFTEGRWGANIGYCDYGLFQMGLRQYCTGGQLSSTCDNEGTAPITKEKSPTQMVAQTVMTPVKTKVDPEVIQAEIAADLEEILNRYSAKGNFTMETPIDQMPKGFKEEVENLQKTYREKYDL